MAEIISDFYSISRLMEEFIKRINREITKAFKDVMKEKGWSANRLGEAAFGEIRNSPKDKVLNLFHGDTRYTIEDFVRMAYTLGKDPGTLLTTCIYEAQKHEPTTNNQTTKTSKTSPKKNRTKPRAA